MHLLHCLLPSLPVAKLQITCWHHALGLPRQPPRMPLHTRLHPATFPVHEGGLSLHVRPLDPPQGREVLNEHDLEVTGKQEGCQHRNISEKLLDSAKTMEVDR